MTRLLLIALVLANVATAGEWRNTLKPAGEASPPLTIVRDGKPLYSITLSDKPTTEEQKAADDLQQWIEQISGAKLARGASDPSIVISTDPKFAPEEYKIAVDGQKLLLTGGAGRGVINAVYALLEEDLGCRFYTNDSIRLPKSPTLTASVVPRAYTPKLMLRDPFYFASFDPVWSLRNRTNAPAAKVPEEFGGHADYGGLFVHTAAGLCPPDKYFKDHPEYFALGADKQRHAYQVCPTDPDVARIITENVLRALDTNPHTEIVSVSKNDSGGDQICHCERCEALRSAEGTEMANQLVLVNRVAEAVEKKYPNVLVDTLAYLDTIGVPKTIRPRKNVVIRICNDMVGAWARPFTPARELPVAKIAKDWSAVHHKLSIWDYNVNFSHFLGPMPNMDVIADNIRFWTDNHAIGVMTQGGYQSTSERDELRSWVIAKLMWDPTRNVKALVEDFTVGHYGPAAAELIEYEQLLITSAKADKKELDNPPSGIRYPMTIGLFSKDFLAKASDIFARAEKSAGNDETILHRVERAELPILYVKLMQGSVTRELLDRFERLARREKVDWLLEWQVRLDQQLATWRKQLPPEPLVISKGKESYTYQAFPDACRLKNGDIFAVFYAGYGHVSLAADDYPRGGRICMVRSSDEGKTWSEPQVLFDGPDDERDPHIAQLDDGTLVCTFFAWKLKAGEHLAKSSDFSWKAFPKISQLVGSSMVKSHDNGKTWDTTSAPIAPAWVCSAPVRQLDDGTCVLGLYRSKPKSDMSYGGVIRSRDRCQTWETPAEIDPDSGVDLDAETDVIKLKDGRLFAALRSSKADMCFSTSDDEGKTWSKIQDIGFKGHCPHLNRLSTGEIILSHRVPNTSIHISRDETKTWQGPYEIDSCIGAYPATVELKDHTVLIVYYSEGAGSVIRAKRFKVKPDGIEFLPLR